MNQIQIKERLESLIAEEKRQIAELNVDQETAMEVKANQPAFPSPSEDGFDAGFDAWNIYFKENENALHVADCYAAIERFTESLNADLVECNSSTKYILTDGSLTSPSGFSPETDKVFIKNKVWIETDRLPEHTNLKIYDLKKVFQN
jgi:hypothetical protein